MSRLQGFERRLSGLVNGAVAKVFRGQVQPVEIAQALTDEAEARKVIGASRTLVPNRYVVDLGTSDHTRLAPYSEALSAELAEIVTEHARDARWSFVGPVTVHLALDTKLDPGVFRVRADVDGHVGGELEPDDDHEPPADEIYAPEAVVAHADVPEAPAPPVAPDHALYAPIPVDVDLPVDLPPAPPVVPAAPVPAPAPAPAPRPAVIEAAPARLEISDGRIATLGARVTRIGRSADCDIRVDDTAVSRIHAEVRRQSDGRHLLADLDSTNGTRVNGAPGTQHWLQPGDTIELGGTTLRYLTG